MQVIRIVLCELVVLFLIMCVVMRYGDAWVRAMNRLDAWLKKTF